MKHIFSWCNPETTKEPSPLKALEFTEDELFTIEDVLLEKIDDYEKVYRNDFPRYEERCGITDARKVLKKIQDFLKEEE